jgi:ERI1 exoribonuclease 3
MSKKSEFRAGRNEARNQTIVNLNDAIGRIDYIAVLDFEATCDNAIRMNVQEIIEFPTLFVSTETGKIDYTFHTYVKPQVNPTLTAFCTELTGIEQATVDAGISLDEALRQHQHFLTTHGLESAVDAAEKVASVDEQGENKTKKFIYATCGDWDLLTCLPKELQYHGRASTCPRNLRSWCNLKKAFVDLYNCKPKGMGGMLNHIGLQLEGRHHSGIDDCRNLARVVEIMLQQGWIPKLTGTTLT